MREGIRVRELQGDEGNRLLRIVSGTTSIPALVLVIEL